MCSIKKFLLPISLIFVLLLIACSWQRHGTSVMGIVQVKQRFWDSTSNSFYEDKYLKGLQAWYKDSTVILESLLINIDNQNKANTNVAVDHFIYIDLKTKSFYEYKSFSDTAKIIKQYTQPETVRVPDSWSFYMYQKMVYKGNRKALTDTLIGTVHYKRFSVSEIFKVETGDRHFSCVAYLRCDKKKSVFHLDRAFDESSACPLTKIIYYNEVGTPLQAHELDYIRDTLSRNELKVFAAWKKNAEFNPIRHLTAPTAKNNR